MPDLKKLLFQKSSSEEEKYLKKKIDYEIMSMSYFHNVLISASHLNISS